MHVITLGKLVHGGQAIAELENGKRVFVWNGLPGEKVAVELIREKKDYAEGIAVDVIEASPERTTPKDKAYLSTSPWQMMTMEAEQAYKAQILAETIDRAGVTLQHEQRWHHNDAPWRYRNKMEYSFCDDGHGLQLALFERGSHRKQVVEGSAIARAELDKVAQGIRDILQANAIKSSSLKALVVRCTQSGQVAAALFVKDKSFPQLSSLANVCQGVGVYYSSPNSPGSVISQDLYSYGTIALTDTIHGIQTHYDVHSFFQVNLKPFESALQVIRDALRSASGIVDFYSGVGTMVRPLGATKMVEVDARNVQFAQQNVANTAEIVHATAEKSLEHIPSTGGLALDPPRAGLHKKVTQAIRDAQPEIIAYLSCNPSTQARDIAKLQDHYKVVSLDGYNFFPRTPHIESLVILERV